MGELKDCVHTDVSHNSGHDDLLFPGGTNSGAELGVIPGIDLPLTLDKGSLGVHIKNLLRQRAIRSYT
jgi:hypothetical protein